MGLHRRRYGLAVSALKQVTNTHWIYPAVVFAEALAAKGGQFTNGVQPRRSK